MERMIIGIAGKKRSGKDTLCDLLEKHHPFQRTAYAQALWDILLVTDPLIPDGERGVHYRLSWLNDKFGYEYCKSNFVEVRRLMQRLGTDGVRKHIGQTTWLDIVERKILASPEISFLISDVRFANEARSIKSMGGIVVKLERDGTGGDDHISETIDGIQEDVFYMNNGDLNDLDSFATELIRR